VHDVPTANPAAPQGLATGDSGNIFSQPLIFTRDLITSAVNNPSRTFFWI
jgi:hypothetical protein